MKASTKKTAAVLLTLAMLFAIAACGNTAKNPAENPGTLSASAPENNGKTPEQGNAPEVKDELVIGFNSVPSNYDPLNGFYNGVQILYSALVQTNADMEIVSDLATDYTVNEDALTYTFILRDGAKFSDGTAITAEDVIFSFETAKGNASSLDLSKMESISANGNEITIRLNKPDSTFILTVCNVGIVPKASYGEDFALNPISSGPYKLVQYDVDQQFILEANEHYYGAAPGISRVVFVKMADQDTRLMAVSPVRSMLL